MSPVTKDPASINLKDLIYQAVHQRSPHKAGIVADILRARGLTYNQSLAYINKVAIISRRDWDALIYESDDYPEGTEPG
jgi:hypothetical protein